MAGNRALVAEDVPATVDAAVRLLHAMIPDREKARIAAMQQDDLIMLHFGLGQWIRNNFGLWQGNVKLLASTEKQDPDQACDVIILALWQRLRDELPKLH